jgi:hypothetical protein
MPPFFLIANGRHLRLPEIGREGPATVCAPLVVSLTVKPNQPEDDGEYVFQTWPCQTRPCQLPGANVIASPKIPSLTWVHARRHDKGRQLRRPI